MSRRIWDFPGGVHPPENKTQSSQSPIRTAAIPAHLIVPVQQHIGAPAKPIVNVGDTVLKGQKIAHATGFVSLPVHAPSSGVVDAIGLHAVQHPSQLDALCITIKTDGEDKWCERQPLTDYQNHSKQDVLDRIRDAGISGMGGAGFPTVVKLGLKPDTKIEQLILNAVECEPYITADDRLMQERADEIVAGLQIMAWLVEPKEVLIGIEDNKPQAIAAMRKACEGSGFEVVVVPTKYPSGGEKQLIHLLTGKEVQSGGLPLDVGVVCQNTGTAYAVKRAIIDGEPLISRITTLTGNAIAEKGNYEVLLGTPVVDLLEQAGVDSSKMHRLIMGGPMMGFALHDSSIPVVKTTNCILAPTEQEFPDPAPEQPCIRCGSCAQACPVNLLPQQLYWFSKHKEFDKAGHFNLFDCIECGACSYVCPSNIPLVQYYRFAKGSIRIQDQEARKADHARMRFEARKERIEKEEHEKELKRQERAKAAAAKQAAKKAAPAAKTEATAENAGTGSVDELTKLQTAAASTMKRYKDAQKALETAEKNGADHIDALRKKVEQLKQKADAAKEAFVAAKKASKDETRTETPADDPLAALKQASIDDFNAFRAAEEELAQAEAAGSDNLDALREKVETLKAKSHASKAAMKEARAKEKADIQARNAAQDPVKQAKLEAAKTQVLLKKARKALEAAQAGGEGDVAALTQSLQEAEAAATAAEQAVKEVEGVE